MENNLAKFDLPDFDGEEMKAPPKVIQEEAKVGGMFSNKAKEFESNAPFKSTKP